MSKELLQDIIDNFAPEKFVRFFREKNRSFAPQKEELFQYNDENFQNGLKLGEIRFSQDENIFICAFESSKPLSERSGKKAQYEKGKKILKETQSDAGIFIFHDTDNNFRFSLIYAEYLGVRRRFSYFKRLTFFVSPRLTNKTFLQQIGEWDFSCFESIKEAFSVEPVTRQFYGELQYWYFWAMDKIKFPDDYKYSNDPTKDKEIRNATNLIRLITRIIFIWFLTEKGLIPLELFSREKLGRIVKDFIKGKKASNFYNTILQNLFFGTLNQKMDERKFAQESSFQTNRKEYGVKNLYRYGDKFLISKDGVLELFKDIPFLNGGLFDCLDKENGSGKVIYVEGFSRNQAKQSIIPDYLFFQQEEERVDLSNYGLGASRPVRGLIEILNSYNFTIDENTPVDQEIALDPELLGKVFENLLASYNPETATTARKATGSYYTPREIVDYMVEESLMAYLSNVIENTPSVIASEAKQSNSTTEIASDSSNPRNDGDFRLRQLLSYSEEIPEFSEPERQKMISAIDDIKILDPACGSGAFPMGILHKLVYSLQKLDPQNKYWHELQYQKALKESEQVFKQDDKNERQERLKEINEAFDEGINYPDYARKLYLIENCIYGVDIQPIAIQISKLRFFISLVLDQKVDRGKENLGIRALPNLETKFVAANTLIGLDIPKEDLLSGISEIKPIQDELAKERHKYFSAKTRKEKKEYQKQDKKLREKIAEIIKKLLINKKQEDIIQTKKLIDEKQLELQRITQEPDHTKVIELSNLFGEKEQIKIDKKKEKIERIKLSIKASEKQLKNLQKQVEGDSVIKIAKKIAQFNLFDQNASSDWFDPEWMFGVRDGFDVVIANPPYIGIEDISWDLRKFYEAIFKTAIGRFDLYLLFIEKAMQIKLPSGVFAFIIPGKFLNNKQFVTARKLICENHGVTVVKIDDKVFSESQVDSVIVLNYLPVKSSKPKYKAFKITSHELQLLSETEVETILQDKEVIFRLEINAKLEKLISKIKNNTFKFIEIGEAKDGIIAGLLKDILFLKNKANKDCYPLYFGKQINRYYLGNTDIYVDYRPDFMLHEELKRKKGSAPGLRMREKRIFEREKIIYRKVGKELIAAYDGKGVYYEQTIHSAHVSDKRFKIKYVLGLFNSMLIKFYYQKTNSQGGDIFPQVRISSVENLPIKLADNKTQKMIENLVDQILAAKQKDPKAYISALEKQIDEMVYTLYGLTPEEIAIVEGKK